MTRSRNDMEARVRLRLAL
uniref:Uncharacterized protein n=1 Tax=Lepeophtheirus salmonis TaxID=72036 RepID=A0A0K2URH4_LEPSM